MGVAPIVVYSAHDSLSCASEHSSVASYVGDGIGVSLSVAPLVVIFPVRALALFDKPDTVDWAGFMATVSRGMHPSSMCA